MVYRNLGTLWCTLAKGVDCLVSIGVPRALLYYTYFPLWRRFLADLGCDVVLSPPTNERILNMGTQATVDEVCAPVKIAFGHVLELKDKVDYVLVPRLVSVEPRAYICPKLMGLPDMVLHSGQKLPALLSPDIDMSKGKASITKALAEARRVLKKGPVPVARAFINSLEEARRVERRLIFGLTPEEAFHGVERRRAPGRRLRVAVLGHPYNVYDPVLSMSLVEQLRTNGVDVLTAEMLPKEKIAAGLMSLNKELFWTLSKRVLGAGLYYLQHPDEVDGIIVLSSFGCGLESLIADMLERSARRAEFPFMLLTVDEHSGEAGIVTRVEAFIDMVKGRSRYASNVSPHGNTHYSLTSCT